MLQSGKESLPDDESYDLVIGMLFLTDQIDSALKYVDLTLKYGYILSVKVFTECVRSCVDKGRLDTLVSIIDRCKVYSSGFTKLLKVYTRWCTLLTCFSL